MNYNVFPSFPNDHRNIPYWQTEAEDYYPIFAKDPRDIPDWLKVHHQWEPAFDVNKLQKHQLKVKMCCSKCEEIVVEKIREVRGVFDVRADRKDKKVVVVAMPGGVDEYEVLRKARKVHRKARFVELDAKERQKPQGSNKSKGDQGHDNKGGHGHGQSNKGNKGGHDRAYDATSDSDNESGHGHGNTSSGQGKKKGKSALQSTSAQSIPGFTQLPWGQPFWPVQTMAPRFYYPPSHIQRYPDPYGQYVYFL